MKEDNNAQITLEDHICVHLLFFILFKFNNSVFMTTQV